MKKRIKVQIGFKKYKLTVVEDITGVIGKTRVRLLCECGNTIDAEYSRFLHINKPKSCGCIGKTERADLIGQRFSRLVVLSFYDIQNEKARWLAKCNCGNETFVTSGSLKNGHTKSCGCLNLDRITKHGHGKRSGSSREYHSWITMKQRCYNENNVAYNSYGGRNITVCDRWLESFNNFYEDIGPIPDLSFELDRIDVNGNYEPSNCRWISHADNMRNTRIFSRSVNYKEHVKQRSHLRSILANSIKNDFEVNYFLEYYGLTFDQFKNYISSLFIEGMSWDNYGEWHIDHIIPIRIFDLSVDADRYRCFHYSNLQPLWKKDNLAKIKKDNQLYVSL